MPDKKHEGYHRIETGLRVEPRTRVSDAALASGDRNAWRQMLGFPNPDAGTNLGPPSLNEDAMYYLTRAEGQLERLNELSNIIVHPGMKDVKKIIDTTKAFLASLRNSLDKNRFDVT